MSYKFNSVTGRVVKAAESFGKFQPLKESPELVYGLGIKFPKVTTEFVKATAGNRPPATLLAQYRHFQLDNGIPVHLKGGPKDKVLFYTTLALTALGIEECFRFYYNAAFPKKAEEE